MKQMAFYDILQLDPAVLKVHIKQAETRAERRRFQWGLFLRALFIVAFAVAFIASLNALFGSENSAMSVAIFCILLAVRFVDFNYCMQDALRNLVIVFPLLCFAPLVAQSLPLPGAILVHTVALFVIFMMTCDQPEMGNSGLFGFSYVFLAGNPVQGDALEARFLMTCVGILICGWVYLRKHKGKHANVPFSARWQVFDFCEQKYQWQVRMALGIGIILAVGAAVQLERFVWAAFAVSSILTDHRMGSGIQDKSSHRLIGVLIGTMLFYLVYSFVPPSLYVLIGPIGGFCLGFCGAYLSKTVFNCFGALIMGASIYGLEGSVMLRISDTLIGVVFALGFYYLFNLLTVRLWRTCPD